MRLDILDVFASLSLREIVSYSRSDLTLPFRFSTYRRIEAVLSSKYPPFSYDSLPILRWLLQFNLILNVLQCFVNRIQVKWTHAKMECRSAVRNNYDNDPDADHLIECILCNMQVHIEYHPSPSLVGSASSGGIGTFHGSYLSDWSSDWSVLSGSVGGRLHVARCVNIPSNMSLCHTIGYKQMRLPNLLDHDSIAETTQQASRCVHQSM